MCFVNLKAFLQKLADFCSAVFENFILLHRWKSKHLEVLTIGRWPHVSEIVLKKIENCLWNTCRLENNKCSIFRLLFDLPWVGFKNRRCYIDKWSRLY